MTTRFTTTTDRTVLKQATGTTATSRPLAYWLGRVDWTRTDLSWNYGDMDLATVFYEN